MNRVFSALLLVLLAATVVALLPDSHLAAATQKRKRGKGKSTPPPPPAKPQTATPPETLKVAKDFKVELLYSVPKDQEGSWVNLCVDPKGRLITSDQYGALYRVTPPPIGQNGESKIERIPAQIGSAQGLLWAFDSLYVVVNAGRGAGLFRVTDSNNDDMVDTVQLLRPFEGGGGEHGPHAVILTPDGKRLTIVNGNQTRLTKVDTTRVPPIWGEDHLLPRVPDGNGFMSGVLAPGGCIYTCDPDGKNWELVNIGYRNQYDAAYNRNGDLFTYDADMEWDVNTPWYRPTRVCFAQSGADFGWRNGAGKFPPFYPDNLPGVVDIGPGSPTGVCFGTGAKFPAKYQDAFFICDWSYGKLYAVHLKWRGAGYTGTFEEFVTGTPLPLTDVVINPHDGAMYFTIGGRRTQSGLYRVTYTAEPSSVRVEGFNESYLVEGKARRALEKFHGKQDPAAIEAAWPHLGTENRFLLFAARTALEFQPIAAWESKALAEKDPAKQLIALLALARCGAVDPQHARPDSPKPDPALRDRILTALGGLDLSKLTAEQRITAARVYQITLNRFGPPDPATCGGIAGKWNAIFPTGNWQLDGMLLELLVYLQHPEVAPKAMKLLAEAPTQEEQLEYVRSLRMLKTGWTPELRAKYFEWFIKAGGYKGGNSFQGFLRLIKADAVASLTPAEATALAPIINAPPAKTSVAVAPPRQFVKKWTMDELVPLLETGLKNGGRDYDHGRRMFAAANCFACHRYENEGGSNGPDLTGAAGRFALRDLLEAIVEPNKVISDQYAAVEIDTLDGRKVVGRIVNLNGDNLSVNTDMLNPNGQVNVNRNNIDSMKPSKTSMMPAGLLDTLNEKEILDLMAYLMARGDRNSAMFKK